MESSILKFLGSDSGFGINNNSDLLQGEFFI